MTLSVTTDVFCDGCAIWIEGIHGRVRQAGVEARKVARSNGWRCDHTGDWCPDCKGNS